MSVEILLQTLQRVRPIGQGRRWLACCPAHNDDNPSLSVSETKDGCVLVHCFAGCSVFDVVSAVNLDISVLFPEKITHFRPKAKPTVSYRDAMTAVATETLLVALIGRQMMSGIPNDEKTQQRLILAVSRILAAQAYVEGS